MNNIIYHLMVLDLSDAIKIIQVGDYVFIPYGSSIGIIQLNQIYEDEFLNHHLDIGTITSDVKDKYKSSIETDYEIKEVFIPSCIENKGIESLEDLKKHLEIYNFNSEGFSIAYDVPGVNAASDFDELVQLYENNNKLIIIKLISYA